MADIQTSLSKIISNLLFMDRQVNISTIQMMHEYAFKFEMSQVHRNLGNKYKKQCLGVKYTGTQLSGIL